MKYLYLEIIILCIINPTICTVGHIKNDPWENNTIPYLAMSNYSDFIPSEIPTIIEFYSPQCSHCRSFAPIFQVIFEHYEDSISESRMRIFAVNGIANRDLVQKNGIQFYPSITFYAIEKDTMTKRFDGDRNYQDVVNWIDQMLETQRK